MTAWTIGRFAVVGLEAVHERAVDLDRVERQVLEVRERRVAGPEVVEDEPDAELAQRPQRPRPGLGLVHQDALGDLELEEVRRAARSRRGSSPTCSTRSGWVNWRADRLTLITSCDPGSAVHPCARLAAGGFQHPAADRDDQPGLLGQRDERRAAGRGRASGAASGRAPRARRSGPEARSTIGW